MWDASRSILLDPGQSAIPEHETTAIQGAAAHRLSRILTAAPLCPSRPGGPHPVPLHHSGSNNARRIMAATIGQCRLAIDLARGVRMQDNEGRLNSAY